MALIPDINSRYDTIDLGAQFVKTRQLSAKPSFELQFSIAQNSALNRLDKEILELQQEKSTAGATALLEVNVEALKRDVGGIQAYADRTKRNRVTTEGLVKNFATLVSLADPSNIAKFDTKLAAIIADIKKLNTPVYERYGAPDGLRKVKEKALAELNDIVHNGFATASDVIRVQGTINSFSARLSGVLEITRINEQSSISLANKTNSKITELGAEITEIKAAQQSENIGKVEEKKKRFAQVLTSLSLSFEASKALTDYIAQNTVFKQKVKPGSVLNLFT